MRAIVIKGAINHYICAKQGRCCHGDPNDLHCFAYQQKSLQSWQSKGGAPTETCSVPPLACFLIHSWWIDKKLFDKALRSWSRWSLMSEPLKRGKKQVKHLESKIYGAFKKKVECGHWETWFTWCNLRLFSISKCSSGTWQKLHLIWVELGCQVQFHTKCQFYVIWPCRDKVVCSLVIETEMAIKSTYSYNPYLLT